jgi:hypothetical protein
MKRITIPLIVLFLLSSCIDFLEEKPSGFLSSAQYYTTQEQIEAAVNGTYKGLERLLASSDLEVATSDLFALEYITGYSQRSRSSGFNDNQFLRLEQLDPGNAHLLAFWNSTYFPLENCNSVIANVQISSAVDEGVRKKLLGEVYFLRAYYYFQVVRLFGDVPLKTTPTVDLSDIFIPKSPKANVYDQIVSDLLEAENAGLPWTDKSGRVTMGAVKSLLAKVYITMAGYPLQKGNEYYQKAYDKSLEVINSNKFSLTDSYQDLRVIENENIGEHIFMLQRDQTISRNILHFSLMPYPEKPISILPSVGGGLTPVQSFYDAFQLGDQRKEEGAFFYTEHAKYDEPATVVSLGAPYIYKYWDDEAEVSGRSGANIPLIRYADVLLLCAEAKAVVDGGTTSDIAAIDAYYDVRHRAFPAEAKPASITTDQVLKERFFELSYEFQSWYDMLRTRKALDVTTGTIVNLIGYQAPNHTRAFTESDLQFPIPLSETQKNPKLLE